MDFWNPCKCLYCGCRLQVPWILSNPRKLWSPPSYNDGSWQLREVALPASSKAGSQEYDLLPSQEEADGVRENIPQNWV